jgi:phospholipid transport system substrate-binding protein
MKIKHFIAGSSLLLILLASVLISQAGEPTQQIKQTTDKIISILSDPALKGAAKAAERRKLVTQTIDERFDWEEMSRRSLAQHWAKRTPEEKKEFVLQFKDLLDRTYMDKVEGYSGEKVRYDGDTIDGHYGLVKVKILTSTGKEIPVEYRMWEKRDQWLVYDFSIEGVSLINNYRSQFNSILLKSPFQELINKLKAKNAP